MNMDWKIFSVLNLVVGGAAVIGWAKAVQWSRTVRGVWPSGRKMILLAAMFLAIWLFGDIAYLYRLHH